jgi:hypothetical protein
MALSSLKPQLDDAGFRLFAVVHETKGVEEFRAFFTAGDIFLDVERRFYGPRERWMFWSGFVRASVWSAIYRARAKDIPGNMEGEGRILGGLFVIGRGDTGILLEHRESAFGDHANVSDILAAVQLKTKSV